MTVFWNTCFYINGAQYGSQTYVIGSRSPSENMLFKGIKLYKLFITKKRPGLVKSPLATTRRQAESGDRTDTKGVGGWEDGGGGN